MDSSKKKPIKQAIFNILERSKGKIDPNTLITAVKYEYGVGEMDTRKVLLDLLSEDILELAYTWKIKKRG